MNLTKDFTLEELTLSQTASRAGISNAPDDVISKHLQILADTLQKIRDLLGKPIHVSSGYRSVAVNKLIGGVASSAHCQGFAADITCPEFGTPKQLAKWMIDTLPLHGIKWDQIIWEFGDWVHIGVYGPGMVQRHEVLTAKKGGNGRNLYLNGIVE